MSEKSVEFKEQLMRVIFEHLCKVDKKTEKYSDLSAESRQECINYIQKAINTLQEVKSDLQANKVEADKVEADKVDPDSRIVQVVGFQSKNATVEDFEESFKVAAKPTFGGSGPFPKSMPDIKSFKKEINYRLDENHILQPAASEWFLEFHKASDAKHALTLPHFNLMVKEPNGVAGFRVNFAKPSQDLALRTTFRNIGDLVERLKAIDKEYKEIGAVRQYFYMMPVLSDKYLDEQYFLTELPKIKKLRAEGRSLDHNAMAVLSRIPAKTNIINTRIKELYDEESDINIEICEHRLKGFKFSFEI
jgi:hypothetical protein